MRLEFGTREEWCCWCLMYVIELRPDVNVSVYYHVVNV